MKGERTPKRQGGKEKSAGSYDCRILLDRRCLAESNRAGSERAARPPKLLTARGGREEPVRPPLCWRSFEGSEGGGGHITSRGMRRRLRPRRGTVPPARADCSTSGRRSAPSSVAGSVRGGNPLRPSIAQNSVTGRAASGRAQSASGIRQHQTSGLWRLRKFEPPTAAESRTAIWVLQSPTAPPGPPGSKRSRAAGVGHGSDASGTTRV
jgi:hypothetical protein